jgi:MFS family permease
MLLNYWYSLRRFNRDVYLYLIATALMGFTIDGGIYSVLFNLYLLRLGHGPELIGLVNSAGLITFASFSLPAGLLGSRWGGRRMMLAGLYLMIVGCSLLPFVEFMPLDWQVSWLIFTYVPTFLGLSLFFVNAAPFIMEVITPEERSQVFSVQVALWALAGFTGSLVGGFLPGFFATFLNSSLNEPDPYRYPLWLAAILLLPAIIAMSTTRPVDTKQAPQEKKPGISLNQMGLLMLGVVAMMALIRLLQVASMGTASTFINVYLDTNLHVSTATIGLLSALARLLSVPAALLTPFLSARRGSASVVVWASLGSTLSMLPLIFIPHWLAAGLSFMGVVALSSLRYSAFMVYSMELAPPDWRSTMSGAGEMAAGFSFALMALSGGYIIATLGYHTLFLIGFALSLVGTLLFWAYARASRRVVAYQIQRAR